MENHPQPFDVCIVCALPEEARAVLVVVKPYCGDSLEEHTSPRYGYSYRSASLKNDKDEPLTLHISWLPRYGPQEMTLHLSRVLEECRPRIAIMTGICAGNAQQVHLGDLVVAERTFTYDNGKFTLDDEGRKVHLYDTLTYQLDPNILQFLGLFDGWEPLVASLKRPASSSEQRKRRKIACHIKPMASGNAVRADHPFEEVRAPVRGTVAIDMEGAAFGLVMSRHRHTPWLVVKGICDYADGDKDDSYHQYAASVSATYMLSFIKEYVTRERLPVVISEEGQELKPRVPDLRLGFWDKNERMNTVVRAARRPRSESFSQEERAQLVAIHTARLSAESRAQFITRWTTYYSEEVLARFVLEQRQRLARMVAGTRSKNVSAERLQEYVLKYEWYLRNLEYGVPYEFAFIIENMGLSVANNVMVEFTFPRGSFAADATKTRYSLDQPISPFGKQNAVAAQAPLSAMSSSTVVLHPTEGMDLHTVRFQKQRLAHAGGRWGVAVLAHIPTEYSENFVIAYSLRADELPAKLGGKLQVNLEA